MGFILIGIGILIIVGGMYVLLTFFRPDSKSPKERREQIHAEKISADMNRFAAQKEQTASAARTALSEQLNLESDSYLHKEIKDAEMEVTSAQNTNTIAVLEEASTLKLPAETYAEVEKHRLMTQIDLDREFAEQREAVRLAILSESMEEHQKLFLLQELLDLTYNQIHEIEIRSLPEHIRTRMIEDREETILTLKEDRRVRQTRLLQTGHGEEI